jgi:acyl-CoA synthetase (AMP-forming)/AMP-acid ligase II
MHDTLHPLLAGAAAEAPAIAAPGRPTLSHGALRTLIADTLAWLNAVGIGRGDRVAIVLPNGPEMATAFLAIGSGATTAPLNPAYRAEEFTFYLTDLDARALVILHGMASEAREVAARLAIPVLDLVPGEAAGDFTLEGGAAGNAAKPGLAWPEDAALVLHTSGTTARPKIVPLTQANICASARSIARTLELGPDDACLNIMPLFHIHGLMAAVLASVGAGGSVVCTPGFDALRFFRWLDEERPSWVTAVPTMHQAILARAAKNAELIARHPLRFLRSSSSAIPPQVIAELERVFGAPLIESYGMTEATHQMASNPLPPAVRKPGTVGRAAGPEIAIRCDDGRLLAPGQSPGAVGEIVIRGPNVTAGYEANEKANAEGFVDGWFRTGDQGTMDAEGYLTITGRLKEIINRGGEKISPREVDEVLMDHPAVAQVVCFGLPHAKLGEEVAAVVVLREGATADERELQRFVATRVADFKVPARILFMDEIPKGATGKLQRIGLAAKLGLA